MCSDSKWQKPFIQLLPMKWSHCLKKRLQVHSYWGFSTRNFGQFRLPHTTTTSSKGGAGTDWEPELTREKKSVIIKKKKKKERKLLNLQLLGLKRQHEMCSCEKGCFMSHLSCHSCHLGPACSASVPPLSANPRPDAAGQAWESDLSREAKWMIKINIEKPNHCLWAEMTILLIWSFWLPFGTTWASRCPDGAFKVSFFYELLLFGFFFEVIHAICSRVKQLYFHWLLV